MGHMVLMATSGQPADSVHALISNLQVFRNPQTSQELPQNAHARCTPERPSFASLLASAGCAGEWSNGPMGWAMYPQPAKAIPKGFQQGLCIRGTAFHGRSSPKRSPILRIRVTKVGRLRSTAAGGIHFHPEEFLAAGQPKAGTCTRPLAKGALRYGWMLYFPVRHQNKPVFFLNATLQGSTRPGMRRTFRSCGNWCAKPPAGARVAQARFWIDGRAVVLQGSGGFGVVMAAINRLDGRKYAVKRIPLPTSQPSALTRIMREVTTLSRLQHPGVVRYFQAWCVPSHQSIPMRCTNRGNPREAWEPKDLVGAASRVPIVANLSLANEQVTGARSITCPGEKCTWATKMTTLSLTTKAGARQRRSAVSRLVAHKDPWAWTYLGGPACLRACSVWLSGGAGHHGGPGACRSFAKSRNFMSPFAWEASSKRLSASETANPMRQRPLLPGMSSESAPLHEGIVSAVLPAQIPEATRRPPQAPAKKWSFGGPRSSC